MESEERVSNLDTAEHVEAAQPEAPADPTTEPAMQASDDNDMTQTAASDAHAVGEDAGGVEGAGDATSEHEDMAHAVFGALGEVARKFGTTIEHLTHLVGTHQATQTEEATTTEPTSDQVVADAQPEPAVAMAEAAEVAAVEDGGEATAAPSVDLPEPMMAMEDATDAVMLVVASPELDAQSVEAQPAEPADAEMPILAATEASQAEPELPAEAATTTPEAAETLVELADEIGPAEMGPEAIPADTEPAAMEVAEPALMAAEAPAEGIEAEAIVVTAESPLATGEE